MDFYLKILKSSNPQILMDPGSYLELAFLLYLQLYYNYYN